MNWERSQTSGNPDLELDGTPHRWGYADRAFAPNRERCSDLDLDLVKRRIELCLMLLAVSCC